MIANYGGNTGTERLKIFLQELEKYLVKSTNEMGQISFSAGLSGLERGSSGIRELIAQARISEKVAKIQWKGNLNENDVTWPIESKKWGEMKLGRNDQFVSLTKDTPYIELITESNAIQYISNLEESFKTIQRELPDEDTKIIIGNIRWENLRNRPEYRGTINRG